MCKRMVQVHRLTAAAICAGLRINLQAWRERVLQEVHVEIILTLHSFLYAQLKNVGKVAGDIKAQIHHRISNTEREHIQRKRFILLRVLINICMFQLDCNNREKGTFLYH